VNNEPFFTHKMVTIPMVTKRYGVCLWREGMNRVKFYAVVFKKHQSVFVTRQSQIRFFCVFWKLFWQSQKWTFMECPFLKSMVKIIQIII